VAEGSEYGQKHMRTRVLQLPPSSSCRSLVISESLCTIQPTLPISLTYLLSNRSQLSSHFLTYTVMVHVKPTNSCFNIEKMLRIIKLKQHAKTRKNGFASSIHANKHNNSNPIKIRLLHFPICELRIVRSLAAQNQCWSAFPVPCHSDSYTL